MFFENVISANNPVTYSGPTVTKVMRAGRTRWMIENETFNTLKTQGYNLEHNYGHGKQHLATNLAMLCFWPFSLIKLNSWPALTSGELGISSNPKSLYG